MRICTGGLAFKRHRANEEALQKIVETLIEGGKHKITDLFRNTHIQLPGRCVLPFAAGTDGRNQADRQSHWKENGPWKAGKS
jgi:hypothetical protein